MIPTWKFNDSRRLIEKYNYFTFRYERFATYSVVSISTGMPYDVAAGICNRYLEKEAIK